MDALLKEAEHRQHYTGSEPISTVYFGGGTPSLLPAPALARIMDKLRLVFMIDADAEVTLEANPEDVHPANLREWICFGVNRLSIGVQSFADSDLQWMNRSHSAEQALSAIAFSQEAGITNISIDLIYGVPGMDDDRWIDNMDTVIGTGVPHISCYALTLEPGTALSALVRTGKASPVVSEDQARQFMLMTAALQQAGYDHYEISNFALPGNRSRHNSSYWSGERYLGLGPSAHSFDGDSRQWNVANNTLYIAAMTAGSPQFEREVLTREQRVNEYIMTSLRTMEGTDLTRVSAVFGADIAEQLHTGAARYVDKGWMQISDRRLKLTTEGRLFADGISAALFL